MIGQAVPGIPVTVLAPGMRMEAVYRTPPAKIHERFGAYEKTQWYDPAGAESKVR